MLPFWPLPFILAYAKWSSYLMWRAGTAMAYSAPRWAPYVLRQLSQVQ